MIFLLWVMPLDKAMQAYSTKNTPNVRSIRYYSYGSHMKFADPVQHPIMFLVYPVTYLGGKHYGSAEKMTALYPLSLIDGEHTKVVHQLRGIVLA